MSLPVYSSRKVNVAWSGVLFEGFAPDSFITLARNADITDTEVGADGQVSISMLPDWTGTATLSLQKESPTNIALSGMLNAQRASSGLYRANLTIIDPSGSCIATLTAAHIKTAPELGFGSSATGTTYDWVFFAEDFIFQSTPEGILPENPAIAQAQSAISSAVDFFGRIA